MKDAVPEYLFRRGEDYFRQGRVLRWERTSDGLEGRVQGSRPKPYHVAVIWDDGAVWSTCTCPFSGDVCKHAVALVLAASAADRSATGARDEPLEPFPATRRPPGSAASSEERQPPAPRRPKRRALPEPAREDWREVLARALAPEGAPGVPVALGATGSGTADARATAGGGRAARVQVVCRVYFEPFGIRVSLRKARLRKMGLGAEEPLYAPFTARPDALPVSVERAGETTSLLWRLLAPLPGLPAERLPVPRHLVTPFLELAGRLPHVYLGDTDEPLRVEREPVRAVVALTEDGQGALGVGVRFATLDGSPWSPPEGSEVLHGTGVWLRTGATLRPVASAADPQVLFQLATRPCAIPAEEVPDFVRRFLPELQARGAVALPPRLASRFLEKSRPRPILVLSEEDRDTLVAELQFAYGDGPAA
ncbi:MAG: SWIM zinc finger family protein, partial [Clostridia bacterium]|nr:SWIM zinc finger family protein [Clostridia bacterium]